MKKTFLVLIALFTIISACRKRYPEDEVWPVWPKDSPRARIQNNDWVIESFKINSVDSTSILCECVYRFDAYFYVPSELNFHTVKYLNPNDTCGCTSGFWRFLDHKREIVISRYTYGIDTSNVNYHPFVCTCTDVWEVRKLSQGQLWLKKDCCGDILELKLKIYQS